MTDLVRYDAMRTAIAECHAVDEVKDLRDKALALEHYTRQAQDHESERRCIDIRLRAERRAGQMLREMDKARGTRGTAAGRNSSGGHLVLPPEDDGPTTLAEIGISKKQSADWQQLADVPEEAFEAALAGPDKPSTAAIVRDHRAKGQSDGAEAQSSAAARPERSKLVADLHRAAAILEKHDYRAVLADACSEEEAAQAEADRLMIAAWAERSAPQRPAKANRAARPKPAPGSNGAPPVTAAAQSREGWPGKGTPVGEAWWSYAAAFRARYGVDPVWDRTVARELGQFVHLLGRVDAPDVAAFFVRSDDGEAVAVGHAVSAMLADAQSLYERWRTS